MTERDPVTGHFLPSGPKEPELPGTWEPFGMDFQDCLESARERAKLACGDRSIFLIEYEFIHRRYIRGDERRLGYEATVKTTGHCYISDSRVILPDEDYWNARAEPPSHLID